MGLEGGVNLYAYVQNNPVNWIDPYGLLTSSYHDATGGGWKAPPMPPYGGGENQFKRLRPEHQQALAWGVSSGVAAGFASGNPGSGLVFGSIITAGECVTCHWMKKVAKMQVDSVAMKEAMPDTYTDYDGPCP